MSTTFNLSKDSLKEHAQAQMRRHLQMPNWTQRQKLALAARILFDGGHQGSGLAGQITARGERPGTFYTQQLGLGLDEISTDNLLLINDDIEVLEGNGMPNPANRFHIHIYRVRPDVNCIAHTHSPYASALSMIGTPLIPAQMDTTVLYDDCAFLEKWPGVPVGNEEGEIIAEALGSKRAVLLAHHGQLVACKSIEEACTISLTFEYAARLQLLASSAGKIQELPDDLGREAHEWLLTDTRVNATFHYYARRTLQNHTDFL